MRILLQTRFYPAVGGIESLSLILADSWHEKGHQVCVTTESEAGEKLESREFPFDVHYNPNFVLLRKLGRWADVVVQMNISLKLLLPNVFRLKKLVAVHQACYYSPSQNDPKARNLKERIKLWVARHAAVNLAASRFIEREIGIPSTIIPNPYDEKRFVNCGKLRQRCFVFVGRLVSDKGVDLLLEAFSRQTDAQQLDLMIIGDGPERANLERKCQILGISDSVTFAGFLTPIQINDRLQEHRVLVVPSKWEEPFGIVALEGAASGCIVLGSDGGGLPEAIGSCGVLFKSGNVDSLAKMLGVTSKINPEQYFTPERNEAIARHLKMHSPNKVSERYLEVLSRVVDSRTQLLR